MEVEKSDRAKREEEILEFWQANKIFEQTLAKPAPRGNFVFYEGPPYANGLPGIHHLEARSFKDVILRYRTMRGFHVPRRAGWDTHGLPIEMAVEKKLGLTSKKEIEEKVGIDKFVAAAKENVFFYKAEWEKFTRRIGYWLDFEHAYLTMSPDYMESVWSIIKQVSDQGLLYQDYKVLPWCPRCGTALSSHELAQGYKEVKDTAVYVKFKVKNPEKHNLPTNTFLVAWTTTPWTLPGNVALAVGEGVEYVMEEIEGEYLIASREFVFFTPSDSSGMASRKKNQILASQLVGLEYEPLFLYLADNLPPGEKEKLSNAFKVYPADFVTTGEGTGIVHTAVMYGADDFELGTKMGLPKFHLVNPAGEFIAGTGELAGRPVLETNVGIIIDLKQRGLLLKKENITHTYPFCWRCQTPLIYYARDSWYIRMSALREKLLTANSKINWIPAHIKDGRFGEWLAEVKDWAISRERYWGTPLPIWQSIDGKEKVFIGSLEELKKRTKKSGNKYFVMRHGEADNNVANRVSSKFDNPDHLTAVGRTSVLEAAKLLKTEKIDLVVSSDFVRTKETTEIVVEVLDLSKSEIKYDARLREVNHGDLNGQPVAVYRNYFKTREEYFVNRLPNGESQLEVKQRMGEFLYDLEVKYQNKKILIITHEGPSWLLFAVACGVDLTETITLNDGASDFLKNAEVRSLDFIPLSHNADYELDLHRPFIDEVELINESGTVLKRTPEVLDVWFDSGAMPWAQDHQPFSRQKLLYPADFIVEAIDQTRGWFYTLLAIGVLLDQGAPYQNVICLGHILDQAGKKMSKSIGNVVDPWLMMDKYGVDALRFWMYTVNAPGESKNFDETSVVEVVRKVINPLMNVLAFYKLYRAEAGALPEVSNSEQILDQWLVALQADLTQRVTKQLEEYQITEAARLLRDFVADLSQWYLRRSRDRIRGADSDDRTAALSTLKHSLQQFAQLLAPFMPFLAEDIYRELRQANEPISIHLTLWPAETQNENKKLIQNMKIIREIASLGLEARARAGVKVRQPLPKLFVKGAKPADLTDDFLILIKDEVNVKEVLWQADLVEPVKLDLTITPALRAEGQVRDFIRQVQDLRKESGLAPSDRIILFVTASPTEQMILESARAEICRVIGAQNIYFSVGETIELRLERV